MLENKEDMKSISINKEHSSGTHRLISPKSYLQTVNTFCKTSISKSLYANPELFNLALFLRTGITTETSLSTQTPSQFAWLYELRPNNTQNFTQLQLPTPTNIWDKECDCNSIMFLTGYPSAEWLIQLGAYYKIDPEYYHQHLSFLSSSSIEGANLLHRNPPLLLPSLQTRIFQLKYTSIGTNEISPVHSDIQKAQQIGNENMQKYLHSLKKQEKHWKEGSSIVRSYSVHGACRFSIEQAITIYCRKSSINPKFWIVIVWLDSGKDLHDSPEGPWSKASSFRHVSMYRPGVAFKNHMISQPENGNEKPLRQSAWLLPRVYGKLLEKHKMSTDPFHALKEVFEFVVASETQLLETIATDLTTVLSDSTSHSHDIWPLASLQHCRHILEQHIDQNMDTLHFIENRRILGWPVSESEIALSVERRLKLNYRVLVREGGRLQIKCDKAIDHLTRNAQESSLARKVESSSISLLSIGFFGISITVFLAVIFYLFQS